MKPDLVILAAGLSTRFDDGLKQLQPVGPSGETFIDYAIYDALHTGFGRIVLLIRPELEEELDHAVGSQWRGRTEVVYAYQTLDDVPPGHVVPDGRQKPWGTGHALLAAAPILEGPFGVLNADDFYGTAAFRLLANHMSRQGAEPVQAGAGYRLRQTLSPHGGVSRGVCEVDAEGFLTGIREVLDIEMTPRGIVGRPAGAEEPIELTGDERISAGFWGFTPDVLELLRQGFEAFLDAEGSDASSEYRIPDALAGGIAAGGLRVQVLDAPGPWAGITYPEDVGRVRAKVRGLVDAGTYPRDLFHG